MEINKLKIIVISSIILIIIILIAIRPNSNVKTNKELNEYDETQETTVQKIKMNNAEDAEPEGEEKQDVDEGLTEEKVIKGIKFTQIKLKTEEGISIFTANIENATKNDYASRILKLRFINSEEKEFFVLDVEVPDLKSGEKAELIAETNENIKDAIYFNMEFEEKEETQENE